MSPAVLLTGAVTALPSCAARRSLLRYGTVPSAKTCRRFVGGRALVAMEDPLDGDGVVNIFPVLAQSAPGDDGRRRPFSGCCMAPTVTYIYQTKAHWYFSDPRDLTLSTRLKKDLSNRLIIAGFEADDLMLRQQYTPKSDIIAVYIRSFRDPERKDGGVVTMFDYMDVPTLRAFLYAPPHSKQNNGILQRWVDSKGEANTVLRVTWTPRHCEVVRRKSRRPLEKGFVKKLAQLYRRVATFDGPESLSVEDPMSGEFPRSAVVTATEAIVDHLQRAGRTPSKVARIQLYFKLDKLDRVWLMWCGSLRLVQELPNLVVEVAPLVEISLRLGVPLDERGDYYLGNLVTTPGGAEGEEIDGEVEYLAFKREQEQVANNRETDLELTPMTAAGMSGRHFPVSNVCSGWAERHDISQLTSPLPMATSVNLLHRGSQKAMTLSPESSEEMRLRPLLQPVQDFQIGSIYRRQTRDGIPGRSGGSRHGRRRREQQGRSTSRGTLSASSEGGLSSGTWAGRGDMSRTRSLGEENSFRHTDAFRELSRTGRLQLPPQFAQVYRRRNMI